VKSASGANGPARNAIQNQIVGDLPRVRAMRSASAIEASAPMISVHVHIRAVSGPLYLMIPRNRVQ